MALHWSLNRFTLELLLSQNTLKEIEHDQLKYIKESRSTMSQPNFGNQSSRRDVLKTVGASALTMPILGTLFSESLLAAEDTLPQANHAPRMMQEYFVGQVRRAARRSRLMKRNLKTKADAETYVALCQKHARECFGPQPAKTPLNAKITGVLDRDGYTVEKIIFESRPNFPVTANLYLPKGITKPVPGVVGTCGHSTNGKAAEAYQSFSQGLARQGYACLIYDPIGQGERTQYLDEHLKRRHGGTVSEHIRAGNQQFLIGEFVGMWRAWDGIRALDYLRTRKEVDPNQIGVTGNSGGGTMTTWLLGVEQRWSMGAPSCFVTTFQHNMENEVPADTEQCPPKALALGMDHEDFLAAQAPDPIIILAKEKDFFDVRGSEEAYKRLRKLYKLLGHEENIKQFAGPTGHGYSVENREAMYQFFNNVTKISDAKSEPALTMEKDEDLWCTPKGEVGPMEGTKTVFSFTKETSIAMRENRVGLKGAELKAAVMQLLKIPFDISKRPTPHYRILRPHTYSRRKYPMKSIHAYAVETEPGVQAFTYLLTKDTAHHRPKGLGKQATLYVSHRSSDAELRNEPLISELVKANPERQFFTCDVRGVGESRPNTCGKNTFDSNYGSDYFYAIHSIMLDRPYLGQKTFDVLRVLSFLKSNGYEEVHLVGKGWGALAATFAGLLSDLVKQVTLKHPLTSYSDVAEEEDYEWPLATLVPDILKYFDLPDCYAALKAKNLKMIEPWGAMGEKA